MRLCFDLGEEKVVPRKPMCAALCAFVMVCSLPSTILGAPAISYVQGAYATPQSSSATVSVTFTTAQSAGDLNVVVVGWNDSTATVNSVADSRGNQYVLAVGPTIQAPVATQSIYYAKNITAASARANTVTVTFSGGAKSPDIRILEYSGADPNNPVDVIASGSGTSKTSSSGSVSTTNPTDMIFGANLVQTVTSGAGSGFTNRMITSPDGDIAEDRMVTTTGNYSATAPLSSGQWIMQMVAFRTPVSGGGTDTTPLTAPTRLAAVVNGAQINLSWTASTDNVGVTGYLVERCTGTNCTSFAQIGTSTTTTYSDAGLALGSYSYRVRATDSAGNLSSYSNTASSTITDTTPPTTPTNLAAAVSGTQINLSWTASTDNVGVTGYLLERCQGTGCSSFAQIAAPATTTYSDLGLGAGSYSYRVRATDAAGNLSQYSNIASATTAPTASTIRYVQGAYATPQAPSSVVNVTFTASQAAGDLNVVVVGWNDSSATVSSVTDQIGNQYVLAVGPTVQAPVATQAIYYARNIAAASAGANTVTVIFSSGAKSPDIRILEYSGADPNNPVDVIAASSGNSGTSSSGSVSTTNATDMIFGANLVQTVTSGAGSGFTSRMITSPDGDIAEDQMVTTTGSYSATAPLSSGQWIMQMVVFRTPVSGGGTDTTPPTAPTNLAAAVSGTQINLSWTASTDNVGVTGYLLERCQGTGCSSFAQIAAPATTTYSDLGLGAGSYSYRVRATDAAGNLSGYSNIVTGVIADTTPPTAPSNVTATAAGNTQINLTWTASTDNVGVTGYLVERCQGVGCSNFAQIATPTGATYNDTGLTANTGYSYRVRATDAAGNLSQYSNIASATTAPTASTIRYVQGAYATPQAPSSVVNVTFTASQAAGDLNVVVVGWNDSSATVSSVTDQIGNQYVLAVGPTVQAPVATQAIYYARNIAAASAGANTVTVIFSSGAKSPDIRILEYSGADPNNPVDVIAASSGNSGTSSSGSVSTTNATDMIFGANLVQTVTSGAGSGFTSRMITSPDGDIAEDQMVTTTGSYSATAPLSSGQWIMQMVVFRTPVSGGGTDTTPPTAPTNLAAAVSGTQINLSWTASTDNVGVTGYLLERCQGTGCSSFAQIAAPSTTTYSDIGLGAGSYSYRVRATDAAGNLSGYSNIANATVSTSLTITPRTATLTFTRSQQFTSNNGSVTWSVDGVVGGSASLGTISTSGFYTPPNVVGTHRVTATTSDQSQSASATVYVTNYTGTFTVHNDNLRSGVNSSETVLTPANVNETQFGKLFSYPVDGLAFASPLYVANVNIPGSGFHNVVYVATEHDSVYAFDADGSASNPLWKVSFLQNGATTVPCGDTGECGDIPNEIGITGTPVIDPSSGTLYVVAKTEENSNYIQRLHALDITTGAEKFGGPLVIQASVPGTGDGTTTVSFSALRENQRTGLLLSNGIVYLGFASHGDNGTYYGWILGYTATTLGQTMAFNAAPNSSQAGIWQSGGGLATDATGDIFFTTGNGGFDANSGGLDYGDSVLKLSTQGAVVDYFTPHDQANMESQDLDLSSAGPTLLVDQPGSVPHLLITAGKTGDIYVINRDNLGHYNPNNDNQIIQSLPNALLNSNLAHGNFSSPVYFNGYVYFGASGDYLKAFQLANGLLSTGPSSQSALAYPHRGGSFAVSANGVSNGILWAMQDNSPNTPSNGVLFAYDAGNLANEFYDTSQAGSRDGLDIANKFSIPLVANGKVFVVTETQLVAYGLLP